MEEFLKRIDFWFCESCWFFAIISFKEIILGDIYSCCKFVENSLLIEFLNYKKEYFRKK